MAIVRDQIAPTTGPEGNVDIVWQGDPCVQPSGDSVGWMPVADATLNVVGGQTADIVTVANIDPDVYVATQDAGGLRSRQLARSRAAVVAVNGSATREAKKAWIDSVALYDMDALVALGLWIGARARRQDTQTAMRLALGVDEPRASESGDDPDPEDD